MLTEKMIEALIICEENYNKRLSKQNNRHGWNDKKINFNNEIIYELEKMKEEQYGEK